MAIESCYPPNPEYGTGAYRRRILLVAGARSVAASVLDNYHDMSCVLRHDGARVTGVEGEVRRGPFTTCPAAPAALAELIGLPLALPREALYDAGRPGRSCTHLFDIAALAMARAAGRIAARRFDFTVPDETDGGAEIEAAVDGETVHRWTVAKGVVIAPHALAGRPMRAGFAAWASDRFEGLALEAALHLRQAMFVARGRRALIEAPYSPSLHREPERLGACFTFSPANMSVARDVPGFVRDFTRGLPD